MPENEPDSKAGPPQNLITAQPTIGRRLSGFVQIISIEEPALRKEQPLLLSYSRGATYNLCELCLI
jgi:hypothetical protein